MSAFVLTCHHMDLLISAAIEKGISVLLGASAVSEPVTEANAQAAGLMLWAENVRSVVYRYSLDGNAEEQDYRAALAAYRFCFYPGLRDSAVAQALACYDYQSCETPDYDKTPAALFIKRMRQTIGDPPQRDAEPWGFDSEAQVKAAQGGAQ